MQLFSKLHAWTVLLFVSLAMFSAARGQTVTLSVKDAPIETVFSAIEQQTSYNFIYTSEAIAAAKRVSFSVQNASLDQVLTLCFSKQPLTYNISDRHITVRLKSPEPQPPKEKVITGRVTNENGEPVAGVTLLVLPSRQFAFSDANGLFKITARDSDNQIEVSGAEIETQRINIVEQTILNIQVNRKQSVLDEAIVIAYGKTTRRMATGSVGSVSSKTISEQPVSNPLLAMSGRVPGLQVTQISGVPGSSVTVRLRGRNSIGSGNDPLYIVDGVPFPSDMLSSSFGAASVGYSPLNNINPYDIESIEVLKDADGTAIYGSRAANGVILITTKKGKSGKTSTNFQYSTGWGTITRMIEMMNTQEYLAMRREAFKNSGIISTIANAPDLLLWDTTRYTDWQKIFAGKTTRYTDVHASLSGGSEYTQLLFTTTYHEQSTAYGSDFGERKISGHLSLNHQSANRRFKLGLQSNYVHTRIKLPQLDALSNIILPPNAPALYDSLGKLNWENSTFSNPLSGLRRTAKNNSDNFISNVQISYQITPFLEAKSNFGYSLLSTNEITVNPISAFNPLVVVSASAGFANGDIRTIIAEPQLEYKREAGRFSGSMLVGSTFQTSTHKGRQLMGDGYTSDELLYSISAASSVRSTRDIFTRYRYSGWFGRLNVDWDKKYLFNVTARRDGSSRYGPENRFANFGSAGIGWIFHNEKFFKSFIHGLSFGKIRASYGITGNDQIGDYKYLDTYSPYNTVYSGISPLEPTQLFNPDYSWEKVRKAELGLDIGILQNRILLSGTYYHHITTNQLVNYSLPTFVGFNGVLQNIPVRIRNSGIELEINAVLLKSKSWMWKSTFTFSSPENRLLSFDGLESSSYTNTYVVGKSLFIQKRFESTGIDSSTGLYTFTDFNRDGNISSPADNQIIVFTGQQYFGGLYQSLQFKNIELSVFVQYVRQKSAPSYLNAFATPGIASNQPAWLIDRWRKPGDMAPYQRVAVSNSATNVAYNNYKLSDASLDDASFIRLKTVNISWTPKILMYSKKALLKVYLQAQNLFTLTSYQGLDPETKHLLPPLRMITSGIQLNF